AHPYSNLGKNTRFRLVKLPFSEPSQSAREDQQGRPALQKQFCTALRNACVVAAQHQNAIRFFQRVVEVMVVPDKFRQAISFRRIHWSPSPLWAQQAAPLRVPPLPPRGGSGAACCALQNVLRPAFARLRPTKT